MYSARVIEKRNKGWGGVTVGIFDGEVQIGQYDRNYQSFGERTFFPFRHSNGNWYALYSSNYTNTRIMSLPDCKDMGGEEPVSEGFCPVAYFVPSYKIWNVPGQSEEEMRGNNIPECNWKWVGQDRQYAMHDTLEKLLAIKEPDYSEDIYYNLDLGFVAGCHWGDDTSWKIQQLDLTRANEGILVRDEFDYIEAASFGQLSDIIDISQDYLTDAPNITISVLKRYSFENGKMKGVSYE